MNTFVISCGGTGGHLAPGIALAEHLTDRGYRCLLIVSRKEVDSRLARAYPQYEFVRAPGSAFSLRPVRLISFLLHQCEALIFCIRYVRRQQPDVVVAFGGFLSPAVVLAAVLVGCPIALHEANRKPGKATMMLRRLADRMYLPEGVTLGGVQPQVVKYLGFPIRRAIKRRPKDAARQKLGMNISGKLLVIIGGSQGAKLLNDWVRERFDALASEGINVLCLTGLHHGSRGVFEHCSATGDCVQVSFLPFSDQMGDVLSSADLVVSRAGAGTIAELIECRVPAILVPYPYASDNHQLANARFHEQQGGCILVEQERINELYNEVIDLIFNDWLLEKFRQNLRRSSRLKSGAAVAGDLERLTLEFPKRARSEIEIPA